MADGEAISKQDLEAAVSEIKVLVREVQDVLLAHFRAELKVHGMRLDGCEASNAALRERLNVIEERLLNLEMRPRTRPN